ncbi:hypothetical protein WCE37_14515 [Luteimonas sp. MJ250]|uniref:hypothetical protein n=1 Tax=Luteimonas sp. MJ250 TaxID=3129236 RepID=UPI0031BA514B
MADDRFYLKVAHALTGCQLVEQQLKLYISEALELAKKCIGDKMPFNFAGDDYENSALETLIKTFKKLSNNAQLGTDLSAFKDQRNFLSHKAITHCLDPDMELSLPERAEVEKRMLAIQDEANRLWHAIHVEANSFRGHLYFDDESDAV